MKKISKLIVYVLLFVFLFCSYVMASDTESEECKEDYIIELDDGGKEYVYTIDGNKVHFMIPPDDFDPVNASDEELKRYCFPERPDDKEELKQWNEIMRNY